MVALLDPKGLGSATPTIAATGSPNVLTNGLPSVRMTDITAVHPCISPKSITYHIDLYLGVRNVLVNGLPVQALGDLTDGTSLAAMGSPNVLTMVGALMKKGGGGGGDDGPPPEESKEKFVFVIQIPQDALTFSINLIGNNNNWEINWGDNNIENVSNTNSLQHVYSSPNTYIVTIKPVNEVFGWMRAWGFNYVSETLKRIKSFTYVTNKGFMESETSYGDNYMAYMCAGTGVSVPASEIETVNEGNITTVGAYFRAGQYQNCSMLTTTTPEKNVSKMTVGSAFRYRQYYNCPMLSIGSYIHLGMDVLLNKDPNNYYQMFYLENVSKVDDMMPMYKDSANLSNLVTKLVPASNKQYCRNRTGVEWIDLEGNTKTYNDLNSNWR